MRKLIPLMVAAHLTTGAAAADVARPGVPQDVFLMATAYFVYKNCARLTFDSPTLKALFDMNGLDIDELRADPVKQRMLTLLVNSWESKAAVNCRQSWELFGPNGSQFRGLVIRRVDR